MYDYVDLFALSCLKHFQHVLLTDTQNKEIALPVVHMRTGYMRPGSHCSLVSHGK